MLDKIIRISLTNKLFILAFGVVITGYGLFTISQMPVDVFPDLNRPTVNIMTEAPGMAWLKNYSWLKNTSAKSSSGDGTYCLHYGLNST